jgi:hypothetical protein
MKTELRNTRSFATLARCLPARFEPFPSACDSTSCVVEYVMYKNMDRRVSPCLQEGGKLISRSSVTKLSPRLLR